jgi:hypothetical protein
MLAAYRLLMTPAVQSMVAATYVRDIGTSRAFYELLGFREQSAGSAATSAWSSLHHDELSVLLTSTTPPLDIPQLPLLLYFFYAMSTRLSGSSARRACRSPAQGIPARAGWRGESSGP